MPDVVEGVVSTDRAVTPVARRVVEGAVTGPAYARAAGRRMRGGWALAR